MSAGAESLMSNIMNSSVEMNDNMDLDSARERSNNTENKGEISSFRSIFASLQEKGEADRIEENADMVDELELEEEELFSLLVIMAGKNSENLDAGELDADLSVLAEREINLEQEALAEIDLEDINEGNLGKIFAEIDMENLDTARIAEITGLDAEEISRLLKMLADSEKADGDLGKILAEIDLENLDTARIAEITGLEQDEVESLIEEISSFQVENPESQDQDAISPEKFQSIISQYDSSADEGLFDFLSERLDLDELDAEEISRLLENFSANEETDGGKISREEFIHHLQEEYNLASKELNETKVSDFEIWNSEEISKEELVQYLTEEYNVEANEANKILEFAENNNMNVEEMLEFLELLDNQDIAVKENVFGDNIAALELTDLIENSEITDEIIQQTSRRNNMQTFNNKLIEFLAEEYNLDPEKIEEALAEIDLESMAEDKNYLQAITEIVESLEAEISQLKLQERPAQLAFKVWSEMAAEVDTDVSEMDMSLQEFLQTLESLPEDTVNTLTQQDLTALESGDWQEIAASLLGNNRENSREFQLRGELWENSNPINSELTAEEAITAVESASGEESGLDLESLLLNSGQMNTAGTDSAAGEAAANSQPSQIMDQVIDSIKVMQQQDMNSMTLELEPEFLGRINIDVAVENGEVIAHLLVENDFVRREMENNLNLLQRNLTREGFEIDQLTIESREEDSSLQYEQGSTDQRQHQEDSQGFRREGQFQDEFQPEIADRISSLETDEAGDVDSNLRNWLLWKQYQYTWA